MNLGRGTRRIAVATSAVALLCASPAAAATTLGQTFAPDVGCGGQTRFNPTVPSGPPYKIPTDGVLTSWQMLASSSPTTVTFKVFHPTGTANEYTVVADDGPRTLNPSALNNIPIRLPVSANDYIGFYAGNSLCSKNVSTVGLAYLIGEAPRDTPETYVVTTGYQNDLSAKLEADADGDRFGDETQDQCPGDPTAQGACEADLSVSMSADHSSAKLTDNVVYTATVRNNSQYNVARAVSLTDSLPAGMALVTAVGGSCVSTACTLGDLAPGSTATVTVVARAVGAGAQTNTATVASQTPDPNMANNGAAATTTVLAPFRGLTLRRQTLTVRKGKVRATVTCPAAAVGNCVGRDRLATAGKVSLRVVAAGKRKVLALGTGRFSLAPGKRGKVTIKLSKTALRYLARKHTVKAKETVVAHDSRNVSRITTAAVKLKRP